MTTRGFVDRRGARVCPGGEGGDAAPPPPCVSPDSTPASVPSAVSPPTVCASRRRRSLRVPAGQRGRVREHEETVQRPQRLLVVVRRRGAARRLGREERSALLLAASSTGRGVGDPGLLDDVRAASIAVVPRSRRRVRHPSGTHRHQSRAGHLQRVGVLRRRRRRRSPRRGVSGRAPTDDARTPPPPPPFAAADVGVRAGDSRREGGLGGRDGVPRTLPGRLPPRSRGRPRRGIVVVVAHHRRQRHAVDGADGKERNDLLRLKSASHIEASRPGTSSRRRSTLGRAS